MFYANDVCGKRLHIDDAKPGHSYFCPACGDPLIQKRGSINAHHFAHKSGRECDPWYIGKLSSWHIKMQNHFDKKNCEVVVWNKTHTKHHIADVMLETNGKKYVIEFQHSAISQREFITRSQFYINCGYKVMWIFDFCECEWPKRIYIAETRAQDNLIQLVWPGRDRIRFLDNINFTDCNNHLDIFFHINTGKGELQLHNPDGDFSWETWGYKDSFSRHPCFVRLYLNYFEGVDSFFAWYYPEEDFYNTLKRLGK